MGNVQATRVSYRVETGTPEALRKKLFTYLGRGGDPASLPPNLKCFKYEGEGFFGYTPSVSNKSRKGHSAQEPLVEEIPDYDSSKALARSELLQSASFAGERVCNSLVPPPGQKRLGFAGDIAEYQSQIPNVIEWLSQFTPFAETFAKVLEIYMESAKGKYPFFGLVASGRFDHGLCAIGASGSFVNVSVFASTLSDPSHQIIPFDLYAHPPFGSLDSINVARGVSIMGSTAVATHSVSFTKYKPGFGPEKIRSISNPDQSLEAVKSRVLECYAILEENTILRTPEEIVREIRKFERMH